MSSFCGDNTPYICQYPWPDSCYVQGGRSGVVFSKKGNYRTAFFEAFPKEPKAFIRGEGITIEEAEQKAWDKYQRIVSCKGHEFERQGYTSGVGFCKHCDYQDSHAFEPEQYCKICNTPTNWTHSKKDEWYCKVHAEHMPEEDKHSWQKEDSDPFDALFGSEEETS